MKPRRMLWAVPRLIGLLVVVFLVASFLVGSGSTTTVMDVARSRCVKDGFPAEKMLINNCTTNNGMFGFGGTATVEFGADGSFGSDGRRKMEPLVLRVKLSRRMNLSGWEVVSIEHEP
jgi:hypothetical protein